MFVVTNEFIVWIACFALFYLLISLIRKVKAITTMDEEPVRIQKSKAITVMDDEPITNDSNVHKPVRIHKATESTVLKKNKPLFVEMDQMTPLICGFMRSYQAQMPETPVMNLMNDLVIYLITRYFPHFKCIDNAHFKYIGTSMTLHSNRTGISLKSRKCRETNTRWNTAYLSCDILGTKHQTHIVEFKLPSSSNDDIYIGIASDSHKGSGFPPFPTNCRLGPIGWSINPYYLFTGDGRKMTSDVDSFEGHDTLWNIEFGKTDKVSLKLEFLPNVDYGSLYLKKKNNAYFQRGLNKWKDSNFKIPKDETFKIAVSLRMSESLKLLGMWCKDNDIRHRNTADQAPIKDPFIPQHSGVVDPNEISPWDWESDEEDV
eukprot:12265_1